MIKIIKKLKFLATFSFILFTFYFITGTPEAFASALPKPPNNLGLVGYWSMNDCSASKATDFSGNGNTGTLNSFALSGATSNWLAGKRGCALNFDGSNDYITYGDVLDLNQSNPATVAFWVNMNNSLGNAYIFDKEETSGNYSGWAIFTLGDGKIYWRIGDNNVGGRRTYCHGSTDLRGQGWKHIAITQSGGTTCGSNMIIYVNGVAESLTQDDSGADVGGSENSTQALTIGKPATSFGGSLDEVRIYDRSLTGTEVTAIYNAGATKIRTSSPSTGNFTALGQTSRVWRGMTAAPNGNVYAADQGGDIYMQTAGMGNFNALSQTSRVWQGMAAAPNGNVYAAVASGDIYMQTAGTGTFNPLSQTARNWRGMAAAPNGNIYAAVTGGDIYMQTAGTGTFNPLSQTNRNWRGMAVAPNGNVYAVVDSSDIYMQTAGTGTFNALSQTGRLWWGIAADAHGNVYSAVDGLDVFKQTNGTGNFTALGQTARGYQGMAAAPNGDIYAAASGGDIYMRSAGKTMVNASSTRLTVGTSLLSGLVGHWTFDGSKLSTTTATDSSTSANNGTLTNGPVPALGKLGQALSFDGVNDYVGIPYNLVHSFGTNNFTLSAWIKGSAFSSYNPILSNYRANTDGRQGYIISVNSSVLKGYVGSGSANLSGSTLQAGTWYHVMLVREGDTAKLYLNGVQDGSTVTGLSAKNATSDGMLDIGAETENYIFPGSIDDVRIYNRALTSAEVTQLYNLGK